MTETLGQYAFWGVCSVFIFVSFGFILYREYDRVQTVKDYIQFRAQITAISNKREFEVFRTGRNFWDYLRRAARHKTTRDQANHLGQMLYEKHCELRDMERGLL